METREARDNQIKRVQAMFKKYRRFEDWPEAAMKGGDLHAKLSAINEPSYVQALHLICANGHVVGRCGDVLVGKTKLNPGQTVVAGSAEVRMRKDMRLKGKA